MPLQNNVLTLQPDKSTIELWEGSWIGAMMILQECETKVFLGVYMTGIMPLKRYGTNSALSNFYDSSVVDPGIFAHYFGFTEEETMDLARKHNLDIKELKIWYEGYKIGDEPTMYNPDSIMKRSEIHSTMQ